MKDWYLGLEARERIVVGVGGIVVLLIIVYGVLWLPLDRAQRGAAASVDTWQRSLTELRAIAATIEPAAAPTAAQRPASGQSPVVIVDQTLRQRGLAGTVKRQQPTPNGIRLEFENVAFDQLVLWLGELEQQYGMDVTAGSLSLASRAGPGRINASLTLERAL